MIISVVEIAQKIGLLERRCAMNNKMGETRHFNFSSGAPESAADIIHVVYQALKAKGHDPIMQMVGYIISGDPPISPATTTRGL